MAERLDFELQLELYDKKRVLLPASSFLVFFKSIRKKCLFISSS